MKVNIGEPVSLQEILLSREARAKRISELIKKYSLPIISLTINIPGSVKLTQSSIKVFEEACLYLENNLKNQIVFTDTSVFNTGCQAFFVINGIDTDIKLFAVEFEDHHPLGRLVDVDVVNIDSEHISRESLGFQPRKCLICDGKAKVCGRSRKHSVIDLVSKFDEIVSEWEKTYDC